MKLSYSQFELLKAVLRIKKVKDVNGNYYYSTTWGKKTDEGLKATIEDIITKRKKIKE